MNDDINYDLEVTESEPPKVIPEGLYKAILKTITEGKGGFGPYFKFEFEITEGEYKGTAKNTVASKKITKSKNGKHSKLFKLIKGITKEEPVAGVTFSLKKLIGIPCQIFVKSDGKEVDGVQYQSVTEVLPA